MLKESIHICHGRHDAHWLTPDPAWSRYSFGMDLCIRDEELADKRTGSLADAVGSAFAGLLARVRGSRLAGV